MMAQKNDIRLKTQFPYLIPATKLDYVVNGWAPQVGASPVAITAMAGNT